MLDSLIAAYVQFVIMLTRKQSVCVARLPQSYRNEPYSSNALEINVLHRNVYKLDLHYICTLHVRISTSGIVIHYME